MNEWVDLILLSYSSLKSVNHVDLIRLCKRNAVLLSDEAHTSLHWPISFFFAVKSKVSVFKEIDCVGFRLSLSDLCLLNLIFYHLANWTLIFKCKKFTFHLSFIVASLAICTFGRISFPPLSSGFAQRDLLSSESLSLLYLSKNRLYNYSKLHFDWIKTNENLKKNKNTGQWHPLTCFSVCMQQWRILCLCLGVIS